MGARAAARAPAAHSARGRLAPGDLAHAVRQHLARGQPAVLSRRPPDRTSREEPDSLECDGHGRARQPRGRRDRRTHLHLRVVCDAVRGRLQPLLPRPRASRAAATTSTSRDTPRPASTRAHSSRGARPSSASKTSARSSSRAEDSRPIPTLGRCPTSGSSRRSRWAWARSRRSTTRASCAISRTAGCKAPTDSKVWCFVGDGETDEPETLGAISLAARERLDNLIFVVNCNLQRLDGPVRGNAKIVQELEAVFRGVGWNVIKVLWGSEWDDADRRGSLRALRRGGSPKSSTASTRSTRSRAAPTSASTSGASTPSSHAASNT